MHLFLYLFIYFFSESVPVPGGSVGLNKNICAHMQA